MYVVPLLSAAALLGREVCGSKAYELSSLFQSGYPVPDGFVLTDAAYRRVQRENVVAQKLTRQVLMETELPDELKSEIVPAFESLIRVYGSVSVRSSASAEDLANASFAGQYETILDVKTVSDLMDAIKLCWASAFDPRVVAYTHKKSITTEDCRMSVLIQGMVRAETSGVAFSIHPVTNEDVIVINVSYGLGEAVVSGVVTPDTFIFRKQTGELCKALGAKEVKIVFGATDVEEVETSAEEQSQFCLSDDEARELSRVVQSLELDYKNPVDVEFAHQQGHLYILQVRPITTRRGEVKSELSV